MILLAKALSGGHVPIGALLTRKDIFDRLFNRMDRAVVHGSTFAKNDLAMAAGIATLAVIDSENMVENAARTGERLLASFRAMAGRHEMLREARGLGLMIGVEFGAPSSLKLRASWSMIEAANKGLFCQLITIPLFKEHKILTQVAGHGSHTIKLLPSYLHHGRRLHLDRNRIRPGDRRKPPRTRRDLVARQDPDRKCDGGKARAVTSHASPTRRFPAHRERSMT